MEGGCFYLSDVNENQLQQLFREQGNLPYRAGGKIAEEDISVSPKIIFFAATHWEI